MYQQYPRSIFQESKMAANLYFQWQNDALRKTIYPMREVKLRDFLVYFNEIDLWKQYKNMAPAAIQGEVRTYNDAQAAALVAAYKTYTDLRAYFLKADARAEYAKFSPIDQAELDRINEFHGGFITYLPKYTDVRSEENFVLNQVPTWKEHCRIVRLQFGQKTRRLENMDPAHPKYPIETKELEQLRNVTVPMAEAELDRIEDFAAAIERIKPRRLEFDKSQKTAQARKAEINRRLPELDSEIKPLETKQQDLSAALTRLKTPPALAPVQAYFSSADASAQLRARAPQVDQARIDKVNGLHKALMDEFNYVKDPAVKLATIKNHSYNWQQEVRALEKEAATLETNLANMPADWKERPARQTRLNQIRNTDLKVTSAEMDKINDFYAAFDFSLKPKADLDREIQAKQTELTKVQQELTGYKKEQSDLQAELRSIDAAAGGSQEKFMTTYVPAREVTPRDIALWKGEAYKASLAGKDQAALLEEIAKRFWREPERYPLWLQYMIVHFSGMRYASAHGSWADPKDLLIRLGAPKVEAGIKALDDAAVEQRCKEKVALYEGTGTPKPKLATTTDPEWKQRIGWNLPNVKAPGPKTRRIGLTELSKDEAAYEIRSKPTQEVLDTLLSMKSQFPAWAWKEIIKLTPLRVTEVTDAGWEKLTAQEESERYLPQHNDIRAILDAWENFDATAWREEHGRTHELIVSRAVCNETAEHCQHIRGHLPPGGLTPKPGWYRKNEDENKLSGAPRPYYAYATSEKDYTVGASILWLRFVNNEPNPWQIAKAVSTKSGVGLMPGTLGGTKSGGAGWTYHAGDTVTRSRTTITADKQRVQEQQWLRWIHEATVAEVGETADGKVILTYETALPDDDRGSSSIGIFKKPLEWFLTDGSEDDYNRSFVGYVPEGQAPAQDLVRMLDWSKILRRPIQPAEVAAYKKKYPFA
jgi:hypothetical protein